jgi:uncharacterized protein (DUF58 family)
VQYPKVKPRESIGSETAGVYADLDELIRLQFNVHGFSFLPKQPVRSLLAGRRGSLLRGRGLDFEEIRGYIPGDDIRAIDWRVTARTGKPHTRVYTEERDRPVLLVVDQRLGMFFGSKTAMKSVTAARVAAMGAWRTLSVGDRVGALVFNDREIREISPHRSRQRVMEILRIMVEMNHALRVDGSLRPEPAMLNRALEKAQHLAKHDYLVAIVSDFDGADEETRGAVTRLSTHNDVLALFIYDPLEAHLPESWKMVVSQGELQLEVDTGDGRLRERFAGQLEQNLRSATDLLLKRGIPILPIQTSEGIRDQLWRLLGHALGKSKGASGGSG